MGYHGNGRNISLGTHRVFGAAVAIVAFDRQKGDGWRNWIRQDLASTVLNLAANPTGYYPEAVWSMPLQAGEIGASSIGGSGTISSANLYGGYNLEAALSGSGTISNAGIEYPANLSATLTGSGTFSGDIAGAVNLSATLTGSGDLVGALSGGADIFASLSGSGTIVGALTGGADLFAALSGSGTLTGDIAGAVSLTATLTGTGTISSADLRGSASLAATVGGQGTISGAALDGLGNLTATLTGTGTITGAIRADAYIAADITVTGTGITTAADIANAVWDAIASQHTTPGTMGEAMGAAGGAGDPWITSLPGSYTGEQAGAILSELKRLARSRLIVDTTTTPWTAKRIREGTGTQQNGWLDGEVLRSWALYKVDGTGIVVATDPVGWQV